VIRHLRVLAVFLFLSPALLAQNLNMGSTYESIDQMAISVTTTFTDGTMVRTDRLGEGVLQSTLRDAQGRALASLDTDATGEIRFRVKAGDDTERTYAARAAVTLTADWANVQLHRTWNETSLALASGVPSLVWRGDFLMADTPRLGISTLGLEKRFSRDAEAYAIASVVSDFGGVETRSKRHDSADAALPNWTTGVYVAGRLESVMGMAWVESTQTLYWKLPDGSLGEVGPNTFPEGWTRFRPNQAWANVQAFSFYRYALEHGQLRIEPWTPDRPRRDRLTVAVNTDVDGCTGLHWLDGTVYRACCDEHDRCYNKQNPDCTAWSWLWPGSWQCFMCNLRVVGCFLTGGGGGTRTGPFNRDTGDSGCSRNETGACPAYCASC
jgi:hypothetical protein